MPRALFFGIFVLAACGGGPRKPGAEPGKTYFWRVVSSTVEFGTCTDDPDFRDGVKAIPFEENSYLMYQVAKDGRTATTVSCTRLDASSCSPAENPITFDVAATELSWSSETKQPFGMGGCQLQDAQSWILTDRGPSLELAVTHALSLVDKPTDCDALEQQIKNTSPNGLGVQGCVVTFRVECVTPGA